MDLLMIKNEDVEKWSKDPEEAEKKIEAWLKAWQEALENIDSNEANGLKRLLDTCFPLTSTLQRSQRSENSSMGSKELEDFVFILTTDGKAWDLGELNDVLKSCGVQIEDASKREE